MKVLKFSLSFLLVVLAVFLLYFSINALDLSALLEDIVPLEVMQQDAGLEKAVKRINDSLSDDNQEKTLRNLNRLLDDFADKIHLDTKTKLDLFFYLNNKVTLALALFVFILSVALTSSAL